MSKNDLVYLDHILDSIQKVQRYLDDVSYADFLKDEEKQDAVIRKIEILGEATKKISKALREKYAYLPWRAMAGMRDKLIHDYFDVDLETVWETATADIPSLENHILKIIQELSE